MGIKKQYGFTIIELSLFFAVSGLLLVTLLAGITISIQNQRFTDSVNGLQSFLQQQYNETQITINDRDSNSCDGTSSTRGMSDCLVIGKLIDLGVSDIELEETTITSYDVIIDQAAADDALQSQTSPTDIDFLNNQTTDPNKANTRAITSSRSDQKYVIPWGAKFSSIEGSNGANDQPDNGTAGSLRYIMIVRSPINGVISTYKLDTAQTDEIFDTTDPYVIANHAREINDDSSVAIKGCVSSADLGNTKALLKIVSGSTQDSITTQFDTTEKSAWCD